MNDYILMENFDVEVYPTITYCDNGGIPIILNVNIASFNH